MSKAARALLCLSLTISPCPMFLAAPAEAAPQAITLAATTQAPASPQAPAAAPAPESLAGVASVLKGATVTRGLCSGQQV